MEEPKGFENAEGNEYVCQLSKALCGLRQPGTFCGNTLATDLISGGFGQPIIRPCLSERGMSFFWFMLTMDDGLVSSKTQAGVEYAEGVLKSTLRGQELGRVNWFADVSISQANDEISISQADNQYHLHYQMY